MHYYYKLYLIYRNVDKSLELESTDYEVFEDESHEVVSKVNTNKKPPVPTPRKGGFCFTECAAYNFNFVSTHMEVIDEETMASYSYI